MNDLEICKRIAEIETASLVEGGRHHPEQISKLINLCGYNPLTDYALCFQLMVKYSVQVRYDGSCLIFDKTNCIMLVEIEWDNIKDISKAICIAIIKAHKEK